MAACRAPMIRMRPRTSRTRSSGFARGSTRGGRISAFAWAGSCCRARWTPRLALIKVACAKSVLRRSLRLRRPRGVRFCPQPCRFTSGTRRASRCLRVRRCSATGDTFAHQAFRYGERAFGVQFHPEVSFDIIRDWHKEAGARAVAPRRPFTGAANRGLAGDEPRHGKLVARLPALLAGAGAGRRRPLMDAATASPRPVRLADYRPPLFLVRTVDLAFELGRKAHHRSQPHDA